MDEVLPGTAATAAALPPAMSAAAWLPWIALVLVAAAVGTRELRRTPADENPLANATFSSRVTTWEGSENQAEISPDGRFVAFVADRLAQFDAWFSQLGTGTFPNLTPGNAPMSTPANLLRSTFQLPSGSFSSTASSVPRSCFGSAPGDATSAFSSVGFSIGPFSIELFTIYGASGWSSNYQRRNA